MRVRSAGVDDAPAIAQVHTRSWQGAYRGLLPDELLDGIDVERRTGRWRELLGTTEPHVAVVTEADDVVGFVVVGASRDEDAAGEVGEVHAVYVDPAAWGRGAGARLLRHGTDELRVRGYTAATLWVLERNDRTRRWYERRGWQPDGARKLHHHEGVDLPAVRYTRALGDA